MTEMMPHHIKNVNENLLSQGDVSLRAVEPEDATYLFEVENDCSVWEYGDTVVPFSMAVLKEYAKNQIDDPFISGQLRLIIDVRKESSCVGILDFYDISAIHRHAKIGIYISKKFRDKSYATSAIKIAIGYARFLGLKNLMAITTPQNVASRKLFEGCGFSQCGCVRSWRSSINGSQDIVLLQNIIEHD